jgi:hypothetical protein
MINKELRKTNVIDGNFLTSRNLILLYDIIDQNQQSLESLNDCYFIIERISSNRFSLFVLLDSKKFLFNDKKEE